MGEKLFIEKKILENSFFLENNFE